MIMLSRIVNWTLSANIRMHFLIFISLLCVKSAAFQNIDLPCNFLDSINITDGAHQTNNSIMFNDLEFASGQYVNLNYTLNYGIERVTVTPYIRGCICDRMPCIRLCCPYGSIQVKSNECQPNDVAKSLRVFSENHRNNQMTDVEQHNHFAFVSSYPCKRLDAVDYSYIITAQGQVQFGERLIGHHEYCIAANLNTETNDLMLELLVCNDSPRPNNDRSIRYTLLPICMLLSVVFIIVTLIIFGCIPKLQSLNGKCLICYLATLALGYTFLSGAQLNGTTLNQPLLCDSVGYLVYFTLLSAFLWLSVINFDLWLSFQFTSKFKQLSEQMQFFWYTTYSCGVPCLLTFIIIIVDVIEPMSKQLQSDIGTNKCFLRQAFLPKFLFFYVPVGITIALNIFFFILTSINFYQARQASKAMKQSQEDISQSEEIFNQRIDDVLLYLHLFVIAGVAWILEIISFSAPSNSMIFLIIDIWNCLQGILIFLLLVMRRRVLQLIKERWNGSADATISYGDVKTTRNSSITYLKMSSLSDDAND